ncbi:MAG: glycosyltransferase family 4 protein [Candidatus Diapherotrites archaeon]|nr:glycosyltransferase family 4 protein [Candidatus Diapherotrites archaeon]
MKILFITHTYNLEGGGGGEVNVSGILRELCKKGHEILVFTPDCPPYAEELKLGLKVYRAKAFGHPAFHKVEYSLQAGKAISLARKFQPDIIHAHNDAFPAIIGDKTKKKLGIPLTVYIEYVSEKASSWNLKLIYQMNRHFLPRVKADRMISMSKFAAEKYLIPWGIPKEKISIIPAGLDLKNFIHARPDKELIKKYGKHLLVSLRPLHSTHSKGIAYIIKAMKIVHEKYPAYKYLVFGDGSGKRSLEELVMELHLEDTVKFPGSIPYKKVPSTYCTSEFMVHSLVFEATTSMSIIDSMACGKAVIATDIGETKNAFGKAALLVPPENESALAEAIINLIEHPKLRKELEKKARKLAVEEYSIEKIAGKFEKEFKKAAKKRGSAK